MIALEDYRQEVVQELAGPAWVEMDDGQQLAVTKSFLLWFARAGSLCRCSVFIS